MSRSNAMGLILVGCLVLITLPSSFTQESSLTAEQSRGNWEALGGLYALLADPRGFDGHPLARKSVRSPSRRLRFGRRSDPDMPPQAPLDEMEELLALRETRTPVRLRFGRRSDERAVPHIFPQEEQERDVRAPSMRLRFGRSNNDMFLLPYEPIIPKEVKATAAEEPRQQD